MPQAGLLRARLFFGADWKPSRRGSRRDDGGACRDLAAHTTRIALTAAPCAIIICKWSRICARHRRKKFPIRGLQIDARDRLFANTDPQSPAVWTGFFVVPSPAQNLKEMDQ
jgi:hypothetical protein